MKFSHRYMKIVTVAIFFFLGFIPIIPVSVVPAIDLNIVDERGKPIPNLVIQQTWMHYTYQFNDETQQIVSDAQGVANFPERVNRFSIVQIGAGQMIRAVNFNPHASFGPSSFFLARGNVSGSVSYRPGEPLPTTMTVKY